MPEEEVIVLQAKTDPEAFGRLYDTYYQPIFGFLYKRTGNAEVAKDLTSETFFQALKNIRRYEQRGKPFKAWLYAIAVAQSGTYFRQRAKVFTVTTEESPEIVAEDGYRPDVSLMEDETERERKFEASRMRRFLTQLNQRQQTILNLRYFSGQTIPEIAQALGMKENTIKSHIHRAVNKLRGMMAKEDNKPEPSYDSARRSARTTAGEVRV